MGLESIEREREQRKSIVSFLEEKNRKQIRGLSTWKGKIKERKKKAEKRGT